MINEQKFREIFGRDEASEPPAGTPYCEECGEPCQGQHHDFGIGPYEAHGVRGIHRDVAYVSDCCEATVLLDGAPYEPDNPNDEYEGGPENDW